MDISELRRLVNGEHSLLCDEYDPMVMLAFRALNDAPAAKLAVLTMIDKLEEVDAAGWEKPAR